MGIKVILFTYPQRDMRWLHRFLNNRDEVCTQLIQIHFVAQGCAKRLHNLRRIVLPSIESAINDTLDTMPQGLEDRGDNERRNHNGDIVILADDSNEC